MTQRVLAFVDRLAERGLIDRFGFLIFAFGGAALIILAKAFGVGSVFVAVFAALAIVAYAVLVQRSGTGRLRGDQAGDNCYYLGLIYTLASLAYAIFTFDPADTATTIIQGFGVALATTIIGLVLRVYFNQTRPDIAEVESAARLELAQASGKLKQELSRSVVSMNDFSRQTRQSLEEMREEMTSSLTAMSEAAQEAIRRMGGEAATRLSDQSEAAVTRAKQLSTATGKVVSGMESHAASLAGLEAAQAQIGASLAALESAAERSQSILETLAERSDEVGRVQAGAADTVQELAAAATLLSDHVAGLNASTVRLETLMVEKIAEVRALPQSVAQSAMEGIGSTLDRLRLELESVVAAHSSLTTRLGDQLETVAVAAGRHNSALEAELQRSRENVAKVHSALVDMTGKLAARAEAQRA